MKKTRILAVIMAGLMALSMVACGGGEEPSTGSDSSASNSGSSSSEGDGGSSTGLTKDKYVIGISQPQNGPYRVACNQEAETWRVKTAAEEGVEIEMLLTDGRNDPNKQVSDAEDLLSRGVDIFIACPYQAPTLMNVVPQYQDKGIPVVIYDRRLTDMSYATAFVGNDDVALGRICGEEALKLLPDGGKVAILQGTQGSGPTIDREEAFLAAIEGSNLEVVSDQVADYLRVKAVEVMENVLQANPELDLVYAHSDEMGIGAYNAAQAAGREIMIISIDGEKEALQMVQEGQIQGVAKKSVEFPTVTEVAWKILKGEDYPEETILDCVMVTSENVDEEYDPFSVF